jgi:hypothetical protein
MFIIGSIIALLAALAFAAMAALAVWGVFRAIRGELVRGFIIARPGPAERVFTMLLVGVPLAGVAALGLLAAVRLVLVALGQG